jgi:hypothetical protein
MSTMMVRSDNLGLDVGDLPGIISDVLKDPALPEVLSLVQQIVDIETHSSGGSSTSSSPGVGLRDFVTPLRAYVFVRRNPWVPYAAAVGVFLVPFLLGVVVGRVVSK